MSVAFLDPTLPARLPSRYEVIDAVVSSALAELTISLRLPSGKWDVVYQDGLWGLDYRDSTVTGGNIFHITHAGGWPPNQKLEFRFKESPPVSSTSWTVLYSQDLRTLPDQTITGVGAVNTYTDFTMDAQPWYFHGASGYANLVHGRGLVGQASGYRSSGNPYGGFYIGLKVYQMAGWDPNKETVCQVRFGETLISALAANNHHVACGIWSGGETWGYGPGNNAELTMLYNGLVIWTDGVTKGFAAKSSGPDETVGNFALAARTQPFVNEDSHNRSGRFNYREGLWLRDVTALPDVESMLGLGCENGLGTAQAGTYKMGFFAGTQSGTMDFVATDIRILQRTVT